MTAYFIRRLLLIIPTFIGITVMVFAITRFVPGGPVERILMEANLAGGEGQATIQQTGGAGGGSLSEAQIEQLKAYYGLDKPVVISYGLWLVKVITGDLGRSTRFNEPVWTTIQDRLPVSIFYGVATLIITYLISIPLGVVKAIRHQTRLDTISSLIVFIGYAIPGFVVGIVLIALFAFQLEWFPLSGFVSDDFDDFTLGQQILDVLWHATLPLMAYVAGSFAVMTFMMKNALLENLAADYIRLAMAKGASFRHAVFKHAFRNSLIPLATHFGNNISIVLTGSFLIETIFNIDGFGLLGYESILYRDYPVVMGILVISALLYLVGNILSDVCVAWVDPRVQFN